MTREITPTESIEPAESQGFVRRVRVLPSQTGTRLGMDQPTAMEFINATGVQEHLAEQSRGIRLIPQVELTEGAYSPIQVEIQPPLADDELCKLAQLSVGGALVDSWSPAKLNIPSEGVEWTDFRKNGLPDSEYDSGHSYERLASSLQFVSPRILAEVNLLAS